MSKEFSFNLRSGNFSIIANEVIRDKNLSNKAKGLLVTMISLPPDWDYTVKGLSYICKDGIDGIKAQLKELEAAGYLIRKRERDERGLFGKMSYTIFDQPQPRAENPLLDPRVENPLQVKPLVEKPLVENPLQTNKDIINIEKINKDKDSYLLTPAEKEAQLYSLIDSISELIGRKLVNVEFTLCKMWNENNIDTELILEAVKDNLFRKDQFELRYVQQTLEKWNNSGIKDVRAAKNFILNNHAANLSIKAQEIARQNNNEDLADEIVSKSDITDLKGYIQFLTDLYYEERFDDLIDTYNQACRSHKDILDYLPKRVADYICGTGTKTDEIAEYRKNLYFENIQSKGEGA